MNKFLLYLFTQETVPGGLHFNSMKFFLPQKVYHSLYVHCHNNESKVKVFLKHYGEFRMVESEVSVLKLEPKYDNGMVDYN